jgi:hypothetical protein
MSEIKKYMKAMRFKANPRYLRRDFIVPLYTGTEPDIVPETSVEQLETDRTNFSEGSKLTGTDKTLEQNIKDDHKAFNDYRKSIGQSTIPLDNAFIKMWQRTRLNEGGSVERQGFKFGTRQELIDKMSKAGFDKYPSYLQEPHKLAKAYNIKTKISPGYKTRYSYDIPSDKKLSSILETLESNRTSPRSGSFKKSQEILNNPKLKKEFIKFGSQQGVTGKQIREKYKISTSEFFQGGLRDLFNKNFQTDYRASVLPQTIERMKKILNNKKFNKLLNEGILPTHEDLKKTFNFTPNEASTAVLRIGQSFTGQKFENIEDLNISKNKKAGKLLLDKISKAPFGNAYSSAARTAVLDKIDSQMGNKVGSFDSFRKTIINNIKDNGLNEKLLKKFDLNEITGVSAAGKNKMAPYAYFVNLVDSKVNQRELASFNNLYGRKTNELIDAVSQFKKTGDDTKVKEVLNSFEESKNNFLNNVRPKVRKEIERVGLPGLSTNSPEIEFGKRRINQLSKLGLNLPETFEKTGVTMTVPKGSVTLQDLKTNQEALKKFIGSIGCPTYAVGGRVNFSEGSDCFNKGLKKLETGNLSKIEVTLAERAIASADEAAPVLKNLLSKAGTGIKFTGRGLTELISIGSGPVGLVAGAALETAFAAPYLLEGDYKQALRQSIFGQVPALLGVDVGSRDEDIIKLAKEAGVDPDSVKKYVELKKNYIENEEYGQKLNVLDQLRPRYANNPGGAADIDLQIKRLENKIKPSSDYLEKNVYSPKDLSKYEEDYFKAAKYFVDKNAERALLTRSEEQKKSSLKDIVEESSSAIREPEDVQNILKRKNLLPQEPETQPQEELPSEYKVSAADGGYIDYIRDFNRYARGGRIHLSEGGKGPKIGRRGFLGFLIGAASLPFVGKLMKGKKGVQVAKVAGKVLPKVAGMPEWFSPLVSRIQKEGIDVSPKATRVEDIIKVKKLEVPAPDGKSNDIITMTEYPDGRIDIEANVYGGAFDSPFSLEYRPPRSDINLDTGAEIKSPGDFTVVEQRPRPESGNPGKIEIDYESMSVDDTISDLERLEKIGTGKRIHPRRVEQRTAARKYIEDNPHEDVVNRYPDGEIYYDQMRDEGLLDE